MTTIRRLAASAGGVLNSNHVLIPNRNTHALKPLRVTVIGNRAHCNLSIYDFIFMHGLPEPEIDFVFHPVYPLFAKSGKNFYLHQCLLELKLEGR
jgi:hypothetical protein